MASSVDEVAGCDESAIVGLAETVGVAQARPADVVVFFGQVHAAEHDASADRGDL